MDVAVSVSDSSGREIVRVDNPNGTEGSEPVPFVTSASGEYRLSIQALDEDASGNYELVLMEPHPVTAGDRRHAQAAILFAEAERLRGRSDPQALEKMVGLYSKSAELRGLAGAFWEESVSLRRLGQAQGIRSRTKEAFRAFGQALSLLRPLKDLQQEAGVFNSEGQVWQRLRRPKKAEWAYEQAIKKAREGRHGLEEATAWNNLATLHQDQGELEKALVAYDRALVSWRRGGQRRNEATALHNLGSIYMELNRIPEAQDSILKSLALQQNLGTDGFSARTLALLGQVYAWQDDSRTAIRYYRQAMTQARRTGDRWAQAILLDKLGTAHLELGDAGRALAAEQRAAALFKDERDWNRYTWTLANQGWLHERQGRPEQGLLLYAQATLGFHNSQDRTGEAFVLLGEARIARKQGDLNSARLKLEQALKYIESLREDAPGPVLRSSFLASRRTYYETYVDLLMQLHARDPGKGWDLRALQASERWRARSFLDTLGEARADLRQHAGQELLRRDKDLLSRLDVLERERMAGSPRAALESEERDILLERETLQARMRTEAGHPLSALPRPLTVEGMQKGVLDPDSLLLVYSLGEERSYLWLVKRHSLKSFVLPPRGQIEPLARTAHELLSEGQGTGTQAKLVLDRLAREILGPAAALLNASRLLIVTDGGLCYVPFAALPEPGRSAPLIIHHEVVYLDSPSVLFMQRRRLERRPQAPMTLAVVADPIFSPADPRLAKPITGARPPLLADLQRSAEAFGIHGFGRLPESGREAQALLSLVPPGEGLAALGLAASRKTVFSGELSHYRIVHFATHGLIHPFHPELSGLVLSLVDDRGHPVDGFLRAYELPRLGLSADLVVLSACRTALGQEIPGEGLVGMTRGLMEAGAPRLVVSLWSVEDRSAAEVMTRFYRGMLRGGLRASEALRQAQLSMLRESIWRDPREWAPFIFQGDWR